MRWSHQRVADLQPGEIDDEAADCSSRHRHHEITVRRGHHLRQRSSAAGQDSASSQLAIRGIEEAGTTEERRKIDGIEPQVRAGCRQISRGVDG
jgi:hypothetical protein